MAATASDLLAPVGDIVPSLFPGEGTDALAARLNGYLARADEAGALDITDDTVRDKARLHYAYYLAYKAVHVRLSATASSEQLGDLQRTISAEQIKSFEKLRDLHLAQFGALLPIASTATSTMARPSSSTPVSFAW